MPLWQSPRGKRVVTHWASMLRWIWSISECNLTTRDSQKRTPMRGPFMRECRGSGPEKQQPKYNPCRPVGRNWKEPILLVQTWPHDLERGKNQAPAYSVSEKGPYDRLESKWYPNTTNGNMKWYSPSQVLTAKHVPYPQLQNKVPFWQSGSTLRI